MGENYPTHVEQTLINKVYRNGDYFFDDGTSEIELVELEVTATRDVQMLLGKSAEGIVVEQLIPGQIAVTGNIKVRYVISAGFFSGEPFDIYIRNAKDKTLELGILDIVFVSHGPRDVIYAARGVVQPNAQL